MAKIWFAKDGDNPTSGEANYELPLSGCITLLGGLDPSWYRGAKTPRFDPPSRLDDVASPRHVVVEVDASEAFAAWRAGFYVLPMTPAKAIELLGR